MFRRIASRLSRSGSATRLPPLRFDPRHDAAALVSYDDRLNVTRTHGAFNGYFAHPLIRDGTRKRRYDESAVQPALHAAADLTTKVQRAVLRRHQQSGSVDPMIRLIGGNAPYFLNTDVAEALFARSTAGPDGFNAFVKALVHESLKDGAGRYTCGLSAPEVEHFLACCLGEAAAASPPQPETPPSTDDNAAGHAGHNGDAKRSVNASVDEIKRVLTTCGVRHSDCVDGDSLRQRWRDFLEGKFEDESDRRDSGDWALVGALFAVAVAATAFVVLVDEQNLGGAKASKSSRGSVDTRGPATATPTASAIAPASTAALVIESTESALDAANALVGHAVSGSGPM